MSKRPSPAMAAVLINLFYDRAPWGHINGRSMHGAAGQTHRAMVDRGWVTWAPETLTVSGAQVAASLLDLTRLDAADLDRLIQSHPTLIVVELLRAERERRSAAAITPIPERDQP